MTDAPERIWTSQCGKTLVHDGMKRFETDVQYLRADHLDALLKAEREQTIQRVVDAIGGLIDSDNRKAALQRLNDLIEKDATDE